MQDNRSLMSSQPTQRPKRYFQLIRNEVERCQSCHPHLTAEMAFEQMVQALAVRQQGY